MSETETVNILPGPHGERLWVSLEELESGEPLLEGCANNARREGVIKQARAELDGRRGDAGYARALELLDMLTPTSTHATWCRLRDELVRLRDNAAYLVGPECELVRMDILKGVKTGAELEPILRAECSRFVDGHGSALLDFGHYLEEVMRHVANGAKGGEAIRGYIVDMARFGSGADDGLILQVMLATYIEPGLHMEACAACEDIVGFEGEDHVRMLGSTLVEDVLDALLVRMSRAYDAGRDDAQVGVCLGILKRRARCLGIGQDAGEGTLMQQASRLAGNIRARRRLKAAGEIDAWIRGRYPLSYEFLNLGSQKIGGMLAANAHLVKSASVQMTCDELARERRMPCGQEGALDEIEGLIARMHEAGISTSQAFKDWKDAMRARSLWSTLAEIRIYLRLRLAGHSVEVHAPIDGGGNIDLRVGDCDIEVLSPDDGTLFLSRQQIDDGALARRALGKILSKRQLDSVRGRATVLVMDCSNVLFGNLQLREDLASRIAERPQLAGVFLALFDGERYETHFVKNPAAATPVPEGTARMVAGALWRRP